MGYTTNFTGEFKLNKTLSPEQQEYLEMLSETRRMKRNVAQLAIMEKGGKGNRRCFELLKSLNLGYGVDGEFYCGTGFAGQDGGGFASSDNSIVEYNYKPSTQPGLWLKWAPNEEGTAIVWNGAEKFYDYIDWIHYLIQNFLKPWGYTLNGMMDWSGEETDDVGVIDIRDNEVKIHTGVTTKYLESQRKQVDAKVVEPLALPSPKDETKEFISGLKEEIVLDLIKLRNELVASKKGTAVAAKKIDEIIAKYDT